MLNTTCRKCSVTGVLVLLSTGLSILLLWLTFASLQSSAQGDAAEQDLPGTVRILSNPVLLDVGQCVTVAVWLEDAGNYYGIDVRFSFDPSYVGVPTSQVTPIWEVFSASNHFTIKNQVDDSSGTVWYAVTNLNPAEPFTGTGRICTVPLCGLAEGTSDLHFTYVKGSTRDGNALWPTKVDGRVIVRRSARFELYLPIVSSSYRKGI